MKYRQSYYAFKALSQRSIKIYIYLFQIFLENNFLNNIFILQTNMKTITKKKKKN
jgi:hypothetical protein